VRPERGPSSRRRRCVDNALAGSVTSLVNPLVNPLARGEGCPRVKPQVNGHDEGVRRAQTTPTEEDVEVVRGLGSGEAEGLAGAG
jgi:hypothetical protein